MCARLTWRLLGVVAMVSMVLLPTRVPRSMARAPVHAATRLTGAGGAQFTCTPAYPVGYGPSSVVVGDFNGDGIQDLAVANEYDATLSVLLGMGSGTFQPQASYAV